MDPGQKYTLPLIYFYAMPCCGAWIELSKRTCYVLRDHSPIRRSDLCRYLYLYSLWPSPPPPPSQHILCRLIWSGFLLFSLSDQQPESIKCIIEYYTFSPSFDLAPSPSPPPLLSKSSTTTHKKTEKKRQQADRRGGRGGGGTKSYDGENAWYSIIH
jgi:hypothetical protein